jgi:hypothetical protein
MADKQVFVKCWRGGKLLATYDSLVAETLAGTLVLPDRDTLILQAKDNLTTLGHAFPPYDDIRFDIIYPK